MTDEEIYKACAERGISTLTESSVHIDEFYGMKIIDFLKRLHAHVDKYPESMDKDITFHGNEEIGYIINLPYITNFSSKTLERKIKEHDEKLEKDKKTYEELKKKFEGK